MQREEREEVIVFSRVSDAGDTEKGKLSAGDVHQRVLQRSRRVSRRAPTSEGVFTARWGYATSTSTSPTSTFCFYKPPWEKLLLLRVNTALL